MREVRALRNANQSLLEENRKLQDALAKVADHSVMAVDPLPSRGNDPMQG